MDAPVNTGTEFVITRLDTRALQVMRHVDVDLSQPATLDALPSLDDYEMEQPTNVLPRPEVVPQTRERATRSKQRLAWPAVISVTVSVLTFVGLACAAVLNG